MIGMHFPGKTVNDYAEDAPDHKATHHTSPACTTEDPPPKKLRANRAHRLIGKTCPATAYDLGHDDAFPETMNNETQDNPTDEEFDLERELEAVLDQ